MKSMMEGRPPNIIHKMAVNAPISDEIPSTISMTTNRLKNAPPVAPPNSAACALVWFAWTIPRNKAPRPGRRGNQYAVQKLQHITRPLIRNANPKLRREFVVVSESVPV